jgi:hypothetical protein
VNVASVLVSLVVVSATLRGQEPRVSGAPAVPPGPAATGYHFAGIAWGAGPDSVKAALSRENLTLLGADSVGDLTFTGTIIQRRAAVVVSMHDDHAVRVIVGFTKMPRSTLLLYRSVKRELVSKYGPPASSTELFLPPGYEGDGNEDSAFVTKKAAFLSQWRTSTGEKLSLLIDERPAVMLFYQSPEWPAEEARRAKGAP